MVCHVTKCLLVTMENFRYATIFCLTVSDKKVPETVAMLAKKLLVIRKLLVENVRPQVISLISLCNKKILEKKLI